MSVAELLSSVQALPIPDKLQLYKFLDSELRRRDLQSLPEGFPLPQRPMPGYARRIGSISAATWNLFD
jgi:hypothetical protein